MIISIKLETRIRDIFFVNKNDENETNGHTAKIDLISR